jgi:hypothetical protein
MAGLDGFNEVARAVQLALAPSLLLAGIAGILNVMAGRLARIFDRSRILIQDQSMLKLSTNTTIDLEQHSLERRRQYTSVAMTSTTIAAFLVCLDIAVIFVELMFDTPLKWPIGLLFISSVASLIVGLAFFLMEVHIAMKTTRISF